MLSGATSQVAVVSLDAYVHIIGAAETKVCPTPRVSQSVHTYAMPFKGGQVPRHAHHVMCVRILGFT